MTESPKPTSKRPAHRPTKLTLELQEKIVAALRRGNYMETAAHLNGIGTSTLHSWLKRGNESTAPKLYREFLAAVNAAIAEAEDTDLTLIDAAARGWKTQRDSQGNIIREGRGPNWKASAWRMERRHPRRWANRERLELTGKDGAPLGGETDVLDKKIDHLAALFGYRKDEKK